MKFFLIVAVFLLVLSIKVYSKEASNGQMLYSQAIELLKKGEYKNAFIYFSGACYNNYLPGCDMMGLVEYQIDKTKGAQICKEWVKELSKSKDKNDKAHLKQVLKYYIDAFKQLGNKDLSDYFEKTYNKTFLHIQIEEVNPKDKN
ncbi:MAG: hypothetical protein AB7E28_03390 [Desulfurella sp.]